MFGPIDLKFYLSIFLRRLPYFLIVAVLISAIGITIAVVLPPVYRASAVILVESEQIPDELAASTVGINATEQIQIIEQRLMTRANLLDLARDLDLFPDAGQITPTAIVNNIRGRTEFQRENFGRGGATAFSISFEADNGEEAARVTNELVTLVLQENVRIRTGRAADTLEFFDQEVQRLGDELDRISAEILDFKLRNKDALPDSLEFRRSQQARAQERLLQLEREETALRDTRTRLVELYERTGRISTDPSRMSPAERELESLRRQLEEQLVLFSDTNPKIVLLKNRIASLEQTVAAERARAAEAGEGQQISEFDLQIEQIDGRLEFIADEQGRIENELAALTTSIQSTPENEIALGAMERAYANAQGQYNAAVSRLAAAETGERIELLSKGERFAVIEQATAPDRPASPNRRLIAAGAVAAGVALGIGLVVLLELLNRSIRRPVELTNRLGIQAFGTVPYIRTRRERLTKRSLVAGALILVAGAIPAAIFAVHTYYLPIDLVLRRAAAKIGIENYVNMLF